MTEAAAPGTSSWPAAGPGTAARSPLTVQLLRGLRIAQSIVVLAVLLGFCLVNLLATLDVYSSPALGMVWFAGMLAVALADTWLVWADRFWGRWRWPAAALVLALSIGATASLPASELVRPAHWTLGVTGFFGVLLFCDTALARVLGFIGVHVATMLAAVVLVGRADPDTLVQFAVVVVVTEGLHLAVAMAATALREVAAEATVAARARAAVATRESVARRVHADREQRYAELRSNVIPLLRGMSDGSLSPGDPDLRRRAALEAARLRRMFAGREDGGELVGELEALVEVAERRGLMVRFAAGPLPVDPPPTVRRALLTRVGGILLTATGIARVTVHSSDGEVVVGVVVDGTDAGADGDDTAEGIGTSVVVHEGRTWMEARWSQEPSPPR